MPSKHFKTILSMNFIVSSHYFFKKLQTLGGVVGNNSAMRVLDYFLFELSPNRLKASATDLEISMNIDMEIETTSKGSIAVQGKLLLDMLKQFPDQPLTFTVKDNNVLQITSSQGDYTISYISPEDFPSPIAIADPQAFSMKGAYISKGIENTLFAVGNSEVNNVLNGLHVKIEPEKISLAATDTQKLSVYERTVSAGIEAEFILPKKALPLLKAIYADTDEDIAISFNGENVKFTHKDSELICRLIEGKFPAYRNVIPKENPNVLTMNREELLASIRRMSLFCNKINYQVKLHLAGADLKISAQDPGVNVRGEERLISKYQGEDLDISFNSRFLTEMLSALSSEEVSFKMSLPNKAAVLCPLDGLEEGENILMIAMPVIGID